MQTAPQTAGSSPPPASPYSECPNCGWTLDASRMSPDDIALCVCGKGCSADEIAPNVVFVEVFQGCRIHRDDVGFYATNGADDFGYADTVDEIREEIAGYWGGAEWGPLNGFFRVVSA